MDHFDEQAFQDWKNRNEKELLAECPATVGWNGAANNFSYWCRQVYTGRIKLNKALS